MLHLYSLLSTYNDFPKIRIQQRKPRELMSTVIVLASSLILQRVWLTEYRWRSLTSFVWEHQYQHWVSTSTPTTAQLPCHIVLLCNFLSQPTGPQSCNPLAQVGISRWAIKHISSLWPTDTAYQLIFSNCSVSRGNYVMPHLEIFDVNSNEEW